MAETLNLQIPSPTFEGSTGGWLRAAEVEEKYAITWTSPKEQVFEMPTGGAAIMRQSENLLYLSFYYLHFVLVFLYFSFFLKITNNYFSHYLIILYTY